MEPIGAKPVQRSTTVLANIAILGVAVMDQLAGTQYLQQHPDVAIGVTTILNLILRVTKTSRPVTFRRAHEP